MICQKCAKGVATIHVTEVVDDRKREVHLCEECARAAAHGFTFSITEILAGLKEPPKGTGEAGSTSK